MNGELALIGGTLCVMGVYLLTNLAYFHVLSGPEVGGSARVAADMMRRVLGPPGGAVVSVASSEDEEAWYAGCKLLGDLYLYDFNKPDLAVECFKCYRETSRSGVDTLYKLGQAFEALGDHVKAIKFYQQVTAYPDHPLAPDAHEALRRLEQNKGADS